MKIKAAIINYGIGNIHSVYNAVTYLGYRAVITDSKNDLKDSNALILPGVGAFGRAMQVIKDKHIDELLYEQVIIQKKPILGICLGMQLLATSSEEGGKCYGLNWIPGAVIKLTASQNFTVPNVGWCETAITEKTPLFVRLAESPLFYYDHSYHFNCDKKYISAVCNYDSPVVAAVQKDNIFGVQFHPEKSQNNGLKLLRGFFNHISRC